MGRKIEIDPSIIANLTRRAVLGSSMGLGIIAAAKLLGGGRSLAKDVISAGKPAPQSGLNLGKLTTGHFPARAKRVIDIHMKGAVSQVDTFDYKPEVIKRHGEEIPPSVKGNAKISSMSNGQTTFPLMAPLAPFRQYGKSGRWVSGPDAAYRLGRRRPDLHSFGVDAAGQPRSGGHPDPHGFPAAGPPFGGGVGQLRARHRQREPAGVRGDEVAVPGIRRGRHPGELVGGLSALQPPRRGIPLRQ